MAFCKNCGAQIVEGAKFCKRCGAPVGGTDSSASKEAYKSEPAPKSQKRQSSGKSGKGLRTLLLLVAVIGIGYYLFSSGAIDLSVLSRSFLGGNGGRKSDVVAELSSLTKGLGSLSLDKIASGAESLIPSSQNGKTASLDPSVVTSPDITYDGSPASGMTDEEMLMNGISRGIEADFMGGEALRRAFENGMYDLVDLQAESKKYDDKFYEVTGMSLYGYSLAKYRNAYVGDWTSVGIYQTEFRNVEHLKNEDAAALIDRNMALTDQVRYIHTKDKAQMWLQGRLSMEGEPDIMECGNVSIKAGDGFGFFWTYMPVDGVLFQYIYYTEDDGSEMVSCVKYNRTTSSQRF